MYFKSLNLTSETRFDFFSGIFSLPVEQELQPMSAGNEEKG